MNKFEFKNGKIYSYYELPIIIQQEIQDIFEEHNNFFTLNIGDYKELKYKACFFQELCYDSYYGDEEYLDYEFYVKRFQGIINDIFWHSVSLPVVDLTNLVSKALNKMQLAIPCLIPIIKK